MTRQQLNLYDPRLRPQRVRYSAPQALAAVLATVALTAAGGQLLQQLAATEREAAGLLQAQVQALAPATGVAGSLEAGAAELAALRRFEAGQRAVRGALEALEAPSPAYADYFLALSRQARGGVWITGLAISGDGQQLELEGRMRDASALPGYLRRLNDEPRFRGRPFAQLQMQAVDPAADRPGLPYTAFALRSTPQRAEPGR